MALPTLIELKRVLRVETNAEDTPLSLMLAQATMLAQGILGRPITALTRTYVDEAVHGAAYGRVTKLLVPVTPVDWSTLTITDADDAALSSTDDYRTGDAWTGEIHARPGVAFNNGPYTIEVDVGLSADSEYATRIEPVVSAAILDLAADLWHRRNPAAQAEGAGGGVYTQFAQVGTPERVRDMLRPFTLLRV